MAGVGMAALDGLMTGAAIAEEVGPIASRVAQVALPAIGGAAISQGGQKLEKWIERQIHEGGLPAKERLAGALKGAEHNAFSEHELKVFSRRGRRNKMSRARKRLRMAEVNAAEALRSTRQTVSQRVNVAKRAKALSDAMLEDKLSGSLKRRINNLEKRMHHQVSTHVHKAKTHDQVTVADNGVKWDQIELNGAEALRDVVGRLEYFDPTTGNLIQQPEPNDGPGGVSDHHHRIEFSSSYHKVEFKNVNHTPIRVKAYILTPKSDQVNTPLEQFEKEIEQAGLGPGLNTKDQRLFLPGEFREWTKAWRIEQAHSFELKPGSSKFVRYGQKRMLFDPNYADDAGAVLHSKHNSTCYCIYRVEGCVGIDSAGTNAPTYGGGSCVAIIDRKWTVKYDSAGGSIHRVSDSDSFGAPTGVSLVAQDYIPIMAPVFTTATNTGVTGRV